MSVMLYVVCCSVNVSVCFVCCVFDSVLNCLVNRFAKSMQNQSSHIMLCLGVVAILLLNVMVCVVVLCWIDHVWSSKECVCCACDPNERLSAPSICLCFCMSEVISSFRSLRAGSQVLSLCYFFV